MFNMILVLNGHVTLYRLIFENLFFSPFVDGLMRDFAYVCQYIFDVVIMSLLVKGDVFEVIEHGCTKNWMVLCEYHQY